MREIKFRIYFNPKEYPQLTKMHVFDLNSFGSDDGSQWLDTNDGRDLLNYWELTEGKYPVMQYTGLKDKNGREVFEGDVVKSYWQHDGVTNYDYELMGEIVWNKEDACFSLDCSDQVIRFITTYETEELCDIEVIGNVYQDSHLLDDVIK